jgi:hypothetical protein
VNQDGRVDQADIDIVINQLFVGSNSPNTQSPDVNGDARVTAADLTAVVRHFP